MQQGVAHAGEVRTALGLCRTDTAAALDGEACPTMLHWVASLEECFTQLLQGNELADYVLSRATAGAFKLLLQI